MFNNNVNTANNPITELLYGGFESKYIFRVNIDNLKNEIQNGNYVLTTNTKHYLNLTNCIFGDDSFLGKINSRGKRRAVSFDLIVFALQEDWDEGHGYDMYDTYDYTKNNKSYITTASNWYYKINPNSLPLSLDDTEWAEEGIYLYEPEEIIGSAHFDNGDENLKVDVTEYINDLLLEERENYGLGLAFHPYYYNIETNLTKSVSFFTMDTQTHYEPFVESQFSDDIILDNRFNFIGGQENNLYFYSTKNGVFYDFDENPTVDIYDKNKALIPTLNNLTTTKIRKGVYKVSFTIDNSLCDGKSFFYDEWKNIKTFGHEMSPVRHKFTPKPFMSIYDLGENPIDNTTYKIDFIGVKYDEKIKRGDDRRVSIKLKTPRNQNIQPINDIYYRMYIKENEDIEVLIYDWTKLDKTHENSFILDTSFLLPREYFIEIKTNILSEDIRFDKTLKFEIVNTK